MAMKKVDFEEIVFRLRKRSYEIDEDDDETLLLEAADALDALLDIVVLLGPDDADALFLDEMLAKGSS